jgi:Flp pilus assembly pilin Flp
VTQIEPLSTPGRLPARGGASFNAVAYTELSRLAADESGQDLIEYALVAAAMGLGTVTGVHGLAAQIANYLNIIVNGFNRSVSGTI